MDANTEERERERKRKKKRERRVSVLAFDCLLRVITLIQRKLCFGRLHLLLESV